MLNDSNNVLPTVEIGGDEDISKNLGIFGYRQITKEEFVKSAMLAITDGYHKLGKFDNSGEMATGGSGGTVTESQIGNAVSTEWNLTYNNYAPKYLTPCNIESSIIKITGILKFYRTSTTKGTYIGSIREQNDVSILRYYDWLPDSYEGKLKVDYQRSKPSRDNLTSETFFHQCTSDDVRFWFPWKDDDDQNDYTQSSQYGWWPDAETGLYKY